MEFILKLHVFFFLSLLSAAIGQPKTSLSNMTASLGLNPMAIGSTNLSTTVGSQVKSLPPVETQVEEVDEKSGTIEFDGGVNSHLLRKIWVFTAEGRHSYFFDAKFVLEDNNLGDEARLSLWSSGSRDGAQQMWNGSESQSNWRKQRRGFGHVILLTLTISPSAVKKPSFKLKFETFTTFIDFSFTSEVERGPGTQVITYPLNNIDDYRRNSYFASLVAPPFGSPLQLTLKYLDLPGTPPSSCKNEFYVWLLQESSTELPYKRLPSSAFRRCGRLGNISEPIGNASVAIVQFLTKNGPVGKGFAVHAKPSYL